MAQMILSTKQKQTAMKNRLVAAKGNRVDGGMKWEFGVNKCQRLHIEWINNKEKKIVYSNGYPIFSNLCSYMKWSEFFLWKWCYTIFIFQRHFGGNRTSCHRKHITWHSMWSRKHRGFLAIVYLANVRLKSHKTVRNHFIKQMIKR